MPNKIRFDIISLFPESFSSYLGVSLLKKAQEEGILSVHCHQLRDFALDKHRTVDDTPYGGGAGMVLKPEPLAACIEHVRALAPELSTRTILLSAKGGLFTQEKARQYAESYERIILVCGRYEGVDERIIEHMIDEEVAIGEYVLTGGEMPALIILDAVTRLIPGVVGNSESIEEESHTTAGILEYPQYTKPEIFRDWQVPEVLLSGNHAAIRAWRESQRPKHHQA